MGHIKEILDKPRLHFHSTMQWSLWGPCPLRVFSQGLFHTLHGLSDSLKPWKKIPWPFYSSILHDSKASAARMRPPSLTSTMEWSLASLNHISGRFCLLLFRSRKVLLFFPLFQYRAGKASLSLLISFCTGFGCNSSFCWSTFSLQTTHFLAIFNQT